ncbi:MAG: hypothetical protein ACRED0_12400 [Gammaproteobacteria bacterium]
MKLAGRQVIDSGHPCLAGYFPDRAIVSAVVLLECVLEALEGRSEQNGSLLSQRWNSSHRLSPINRFAFIWTPLCENGCDSNAAAPTRSLPAVS